jgi:hypothetical protein
VRVQPDGRFAFRKPIISCIEEGKTRSLAARPTAFAPSLCREVLMILLVGFLYTSKVDSHTGEIDPSL